MNITFNKRDPLYVQVIRYFKEQIATGAFEPGEEIPSRRELASKLKINPNTAQRAYKEMEEEGLIYTEGNNPSKVTKDVEKIASVRQEIIMDAVDAFVHTIRPINVSLDEVVGLIEAKLNEEQPEQEGRK